MIQNAPSRFNLFLPDESATTAFGEDLALLVKPGDCIALSGDLGAGKSTLARALIRAVADDPMLDVPSPTFTLVQSYDVRIPLYHLDLYRLTHVSELDELGLDEALEDGVVLVEWPDRAAGALPATTLWMELTHQAEGRRLDISGPSQKLDRLIRLRAIRSFLDEHGFRGVKRRFLVGDASTRAYERLHMPDSKTLVLMDSPRQPDGPPIRDGKPYSQLVHLAEDVRPFVAIDRLLRDKGFAAPEIHAADLDQGILVIEDFGSGSILDDQGLPVPERYEAAVECLAWLHSNTFPAEIPLDDGRTHHIPNYDRSAMKIEAELILDWHIPWKRGGEVASPQERANFLAIWDHLIDELGTCEKKVVLRDFHSPNIIWREAQQGHARVGLIDFQDAMIGPSSYDLVSIVQDARVTVRRPLMDMLMARYFTLRREHGSFDGESFVKSWHIMSAQRACKLNGLWVRLLQRDRKPDYMRHMSRTLWHLAVALEHPIMSPLREWCIKAGIEVAESEP
ncbi:tRNA (adenosine(37)-N6)-threonylcarbamoyltransferase complex ATPase subunit type 1 TsaE [Ciceribacter sp. L1K23]|uniref:tRNA (adenosine(37)-N6)-threonylcarbamoyltransferase complex ATPase subunit type 1 TsaE n=1 Tax=Ciceribacter sp. L1K23 TaxID=2820276 RepID=UPI001B82AF23|nr:tRNA (adenosine(37)-N6)-threonylcarbamoyltransferase complex ATPase subunit type 1 TsaE [Ciceribacter sp. L1K23]MBR0557627.1 tRNA (adenosine(37)-N6)-threonylcarbamoyltransferase complex ATPase subunit type 1 TsaE [Ciceribacter sp. L1K23]